MAGKDLTPTSEDFQELPDTKKWKGDYWANVPYVNEWFKKNEEFLASYDKGQLSERLEQL